MKTWKKRAAPRKKLLRLRKYDHAITPILKTQQAKIHSILATNGIQAELKTASTNDLYERQADDVANKVMSMTNGHQTHNAPLREQISALQNTGHKNTSVGADENIPQHLKSIKGNGQALTAPEQYFFESRFGTRFNHVRLHTNEDASKTARLLQARAFTHGNDIVFAKGEYSQGTSSGRQLLAHELTHVVQQNKGKSVNNVQKMSSYDKHDRNLQSPRFSGNNTLEDILDKKRYMHIGSRGNHVAIIQGALEDAGSELPKYGVDSIFGSETFHAVKDYQSKRELSQDGVIGSQTMGDLDALYSGADQSKKNKKKTCGGIHSLKHSFFNHVDVSFFIVKPCKIANIKISGEWQGALHHITGPEHFPIILDGTTKKQVKAGHKGGGQFPRIPGKSHFFKFTLTPGKHKLRLSTGGINIGQPDSLKVKLHTKGNLRVN